MSETRDDLREALARDLRTVGAAIERSRTALGVNICLVSSLGKLTLRNLPLILDTLAQVSALQAENRDLRLELAEAKQELDEADARHSAAENAWSEATARVSALQAEVERLQKVEGEREKDAERVPCGSGSRPSDQAPAGLASSGFDPSRIVFPAPTESQAKGGWQINVDYLAELSESAERIWPAYYELEATEALLRSIDFSKLVAPCDRSGEAGETSGLDPQGESTVTGAARQAPSDNPLTETKEGSSHACPSMD